MTNKTLEQEEKFKQLLGRLTQSPLYKEKLANYELDSFKLNQLPYLPLTTKEDLRASGTFGQLAVDMKQIAQYHESSGTTGEPSSSWFTREDLRTGARQLNDSGVQFTSDDLVMIRFPYALALPAFLMQEAAWQAGAGIVPVSGRTVVSPYPRVLQLMQRLGVTIIAGLPREMELLAKVADLLGLSPCNDFKSLRAICVAGELMSNKRKAHIEKLWGVPVYNFYGSTETANIAAMCEYGEMHIIEQDFLVEVLNQAGTDYVAQGERGFAAVTTLSHQGSPLLRYFNGDIISIEPTRCPCLRKGGKLVHYGRYKDRIHLGDSDILLDALDIQEAIYSLPYIPDAWKVIEHGNRLQFLLDFANPSLCSEHFILSHLSNALSVPLTIEIITDSTLLDRVLLLNNTPSIKPVYIQKQSDGSS